MKRVFRNRLLLLLLFFTTIGCLYTAGQSCGRVGISSWRWRNNDGSELSATWKAAERASIVYSDAGSLLRLRIQASNTRLQPDGLGECGIGSQPASAPVNGYLQYSTNPADVTSWVTISNASANAFMMAGSASTYVLQGQKTSQQFSGNWTFYPGIIMTEAVMLSYVMPGYSNTEFEWVFEGTPNMLAGTTYYFRQSGIGFSPSFLPSLTTVSNTPLSVKLTRFSAEKGRSKVRLDWTTASEENSDHFDVLRSSDGQSWKGIAQQQSRGNATNPANYSAYDDNPLAGLNYYRLEQVDKDGKTSLSEVKLLRLFTNAAITIWPNPVSSFINFSLQQPEAKLVATLQDATGRTVRQQSFTNLTAGAVSQFELAQKPPAGVYVLKLEAADFSETRKIIVQ